MKRLLATAVVLCAASAALGNTAPSGGALKKRCATASPEAVPSRSPGQTLLASKQWHTTDLRSSSQRAAGGQTSRGAHPAVCRVIVAERGAVSYGSGTLVGVDRTLGLVVTNWHVIRDAAGPITVVFPDGFRSTATVLAADRHWDLAALAIRRPNVGPVALAGEVPRRGDPLMIAGYGSGWYKASTGRCTQYVSPGSGLPFEMVELDAAARQGDSGGPIMNQRGELAGVLFGTGFGRTAGSHSGRVRRFLHTAADDFQQLSSQSTMIARRPDRPASRIQRQPAARPQPSAAPLAAIARGTGRLPSTDTARQGSARQGSARRQLDELPIPRPYQPPLGNSAGPARPSLSKAQPGSRHAPVANVSGPGTPPPSPQQTGSTPFDQIKTFLAIVGIVAILLHGMRALGTAAGS